MTHAQTKPSSLKFTLLFVAMAALLIAVFSVYADHFQQGRAEAAGVDIKWSFGQIFKIALLFSSIAIIAAQLSWRLMMRGTVSKPRGGHAGLFAVFLGYLLLGAVLIIAAPSGGHASMASIYFGIIMTITAPLTFPLGYFIGRMSVSN